jgi:hypothetical protein
MDSTNDVLILGALKDWENKQTIPEPIEEDILLTFLSRYGLLCIQNRMPGNPFEIFEKMVETAPKNINAIKAQTMLITGKLEVALLDPNKAIYTEAEYLQWFDVLSRLLNKTEYKTTNVYRCSSWSLLKILNKKEFIDAYEGKSESKLLSIKFKALDTLSKLTNPTPNIWKERMYDEILKKLCAKDINETNYNSVLDLTSDPELIKFKLNSGKDQYSKLLTYLIKWILILPQNQSEKKKCSIFNLHSWLIMVEKIQEHLDGRLIPSADRFNEAAKIILHFGSEKAQKSLMSNFLYRKVDIRDIFLDSVYPKTIENFHKLVPSLDKDALISYLRGTQGEGLMHFAKAYPLLEIEADNVIVKMIQHDLQDRIKGKGLHEDQSLPPTESPSIENNKTKNKPKSWGKTEGERKIRPKVAKILESLKEQKDPNRGSSSKTPPEYLTDLGVNVGPLAQEDYEKLTDELKLMVRDNIEDLQKGITTKFMKTLDDRPIVGVPQGLKVRSIRMGVRRVVYNRDDEGKLIIYRCDGHYDDLVGALQKKKK